MTVKPRSLIRRSLPFAVAVLGASIGTVFAGTASAASAVDSFVAVDDAYSSSARPGHTTGSADKLVVGTLAGDTMVSYLKFKVVVPAGATVRGAKVTLTNEGPKMPALRVSKVADSSWSESALTARNDPALGATVVSVTPKATDTAVTLDVSSVVKASGTYTFAVSSSAPAVARFKSAESGTSGPVLKLSVTRPATTTPTKPVVTPTTPVVTPTTPVSSPPAGGCTTGVKLVPTCGLLWGAAAGGFSDVPRDEALKTWDATAGRASNIYHTYHRGDELFPTKAEMAMARDPKNPKILMLNWKVGYATSWAKVAAGDSDARIDTLSTYLKNTFTEQFFMVLHHEPENDVNATAGSGMTAKDYAAMYRHTVLRMRANGVSNAVFVIAYMNVEKWNNSPWWSDLYPGDDVVDWLGVDTYNSATPGGYHNGDFRYLMDRTTDATKFPGWYTWATTKHPGKPIVVAEWAIYDDATSAAKIGANTAKVLNTVLPQLAGMPAIKAMVYFDTQHDQAGHDMRIDATPEGLAAFKKIAADPRFTVTLKK
jgi:hypothetical protein